MGDRERIWICHRQGEGRKKESSMMKKKGDRRVFFFFVFFLLGLVMSYFS